MPIYAYKCSSCQHEQDVLQKVSDPPLSGCPACGAPTFAKQLTAAGFQLKGSGWYATDFKNGSARLDSGTPAKAAASEAGKDGGKKDSGKGSGASEPTPGAAGSGTTGS